MSEPGSAVTAEREQQVLDAVPDGVLVGGRWREPTGGGRLPVVDPATEQVLREVADATADDAAAALDAAAAAQDAWAATAPRERGEVLRRAFDELVARTEDLALLMTLEMGKPLASSRGEVAYGAEFLRWYAEEAVRGYGRWSASAADPDGRALVMRSPVGPCLLITPWNFPLAMATRKIGPALAAGCTVVLKPAEQTPLTALVLAQVLTDAGVPDGVLSVLPTSDPAGVVAPLLADPRLRKLTFTGSTEVGRALAEQAGPALLHTSMELGGNAPLLVLEDADVDVAVEGAFQAKTRNLGESCVAANRVYAVGDVADELAARLAERMRALPVGRGTEDGVGLGPLIDDDARAKVRRLVADATSRGARPLLDGTELPERGYFVAPEVLVDVPDDAEVLSTEVFGPVAPVVRVADADEAVRRANAVPEGLVAYLFTRDLDRAVRTCEALEVGMVGVNTGVVSDPAAPFGGTKASGFGREGGPEGLEEYTETRYVKIALRPQR